MNKTITPEQQKARAALLRQQVTAAMLRPVWGVRSDARDTALAALSLTSEDVTAFGWWYDDYEVEPDTYEVTEEGVAVIPVCGVMLDTAPSWWLGVLGYASTPGIAAMIYEAADDENVASGVLDVDSVGGQASGVEATAAAIRYFLSTGKQMVAVCKEACSAAYWLASQCGRVYVLPDGITGCIGSLSLIDDWSEYYAKMGVKRERITSDGAEEYKGAGAMGTEITPAQKADRKRICNEYQTLFSGDVQTARGFTTERMSELADGRWHIGQNGVAQGLADEIAYRDDIVALLGSGEVLYEHTEPPPGGSEEPAENEPPVTGGRIPQYIAAFLRRGKTEKPAMLRNFTRPQAAGNRNGNGEPSAAEELFTLQTELTAAQAEIEQLRAFQSEALTAFRADATAAAVRAFGQESQDYKDAAAAIANLESPSALRLLAKSFKPLTPTRMAEPTGERQSQGQEQNPVEATAPDAEALKKADDEAFAKQGERAAQRLGLNANKGGSR